MRDYFNPFEFDAASKFDYGQIIDYYIEDFNYARFIRSKRNVFLVGERGTGKTMTLMYNSLPVQAEKSKRWSVDAELDFLAIYISCKTPLMHRREYELLDPLKAALISEHLLVLNTMFAIEENLAYLDDLIEPTLGRGLLEDAEYTLNMKLPPDRPFLEAIKQAIQKEVLETQQAVNQRVPDAFYDRARSFSSSILPLLSCLKKIPRISSSHFALMYDDAHDLNEYQIRALNSWISYRDNYQFSFKIATAKVDQPTHITSSGGTILEGHDYVLIDMEQPYHSEDSAFGKLAREIIKKRLMKIDIDKSPDEFFPINPIFEKELEDSRLAVLKEAKKQFQQPKQIADYVYRYARAEYFRRRSSKANRPPYSGLEILVHLSTGVIRNLLEPCYWMYDLVYSEKHKLTETTVLIDSIDSETQTEIILERSKSKWEWIRTRLDKSVEGCSREQAQQIYQLFDNLAILFRERLLKHKSEPRAISFTISEMEFDKISDLRALLRISRKAQILYTYPSSAKDLGKREIYYVPNRILWPDRGLDPVGQHARVSIRASALWAAAKDNKKLPVIQEEVALGLFDEKSN